MAEDLERFTATAVEGLGLSQLSELETCNSAIAGDLMDLLDTTELPSAKAWSVLCDCLSEWRRVGGNGGEEASSGGADFWAILSSQAGLGHKALLAMIHLALKSPEKGGESWMAAKAYLWLMDLPGASAYGVFTTGLFRSLLTLLKKVMEAGGAATAAAASSSSAGGKGKRGGKRRGGDDDDDEESDDDDDDDEEEGGRRRGGRRRGAAASQASSRGGGRHQSEQETAVLSALGASLTTGSLKTSLRGHEDLQGELAEVSLAIHAIAPASSPLSNPARDIFLRLLSGAGSSNQATAAAGNPLALHALMALLTLKTTGGNKSGLPTDARSRTAAHNKAVQLVVALIKEAKERPEVTTTTNDDDEGEDNMDTTTTTAGNEDGGEEEDSRMDVVTQDEEKEEGGDGDDDEDEEEDEEGGGRKGGKKGVKKGNKKGGDDKSTKKKSKAGQAPSNLQLTVLAILEHMCTDAPDRADTRAKVVDSALHILQSLQEAFPALGPRFLAFLAKLLRAAKVSHRTLAVELASTFVNAPWAWQAYHNTNDEDNDNRESSGHMALEALVRSLSSRVLDKAPTVRARAMVCLSEMLLRLKEEDDQGSSSSSRRRAPQGLREILRSLALPKEGAEGRDLIAMVRSRSHDDKAAVRKAALQALEILLLFSSTPLTSEDVGLFSQRCNDISVLTRKQAMSSLSSLLLHDPCNKQLQEAWVRSVLPLVSDSEQSILNRLVDLLNEVLIDRVLAWHKDSSSTTSNNKKTTSRRARAARSATAATLSEAAGDDDDDEDDDGKVAASSSSPTAVWEVLAMVASRDLNKYLQSAVTLLLQGGGPNSQPSSSSSAPSPRRLKDLMEALQAAALASIESEGDRASRVHLRRGSWALLEALLTSSSSPGATTTSSTRLVSSDPAFVITCWRKVFDSLTVADDDSSTTEEAALEDDARKVLRVLSKLAPDVPASLGMELAEDLLASLAGLDPKLSPENCGAALDTIAALCLAKAPTPEEGVSILTSAAGQILEACEGALRAFIVDRDTSANVTSRLQRATFLTGAVALLGFNPNEEDVKPSSSTSAGNKRKKQQQQATQSGSAPTIRIPVPPALVSLVRVLLAPEIMPLAIPAAADNTQPPPPPQQEGGSSTDGIPVPEEVRALSFLSLGKVCLRDKSVAKDNVNLFVRELATSHSPAIKSNALLILGDLCVRYTSLVERHVPAMARCLQDDSPLIRRHAQALISQLLLQDYLKWKGLLLHRYLAVLIDRDQRVSELVEAMLFGQFHRKYPSLFVTHFVESMVVFNNCSDHDSYKAAMAQGAESGTAVTMEGVDLEGEAGTAKRMHIYRAMLQRMTDEQRIQVAAKITQDILGAATDEDDQVSGGIRIQSHHHLKKGGGGQQQHQRKREAMLVKKLRRDESLVRDALAVLRCPDIKVASGSNRGGGGDGASQEDDPESMMMMMEGGAGGEGGGADVAQAAKGRLLTKVSRKHLLEHVVPTLVSLKACLERAHSPLLRDVMEYFQELMKASREEVKEALSSDPTLFHEIDYDLQQYDKECQAAAKRAAAEAAAARKSMPPPPPKSPGDGLMKPPAPPSNNRRRSSIGSVLSSDGRILNANTPLAAALTQHHHHQGGGNNNPKLTPVLASCSAPRLRRSSVGGAIPATRTPAEAVKAALQPMDELPSPLALTPVPSSADRATTTGGGSATSSGGGRGPPVAVKLPDATRAWNVTVQASPLDNSNKENSSSSTTATTTTTTTTATTRTTRSRRNARGGGDGSAIVM